MPGHHDLNQAAKHLGVGKAVLAHQVDQLEHAVGATLPEAAQDPDGITLTPAGETFAQEVLTVHEVACAAQPSQLLRCQPPSICPVTPGRALSASSRTWSGPRRRETSASPPGSGSPSCPAR
ncbi:MAG: helix-turn-helix domain-containing protein [Pseudonocardiaceae bacterium]